MCNGDKERSGRHGAGRDGRNGLKWQAWIEEEWNKKVWHPQLSYQKSSILAEKLGLILKGVLEVCVVNTMI
jgi:hypothetical protein